jgi:hypothetical protein
MTIEPLETRIAPAAVFTYADVDGDFVTIRTSLGTDAQLGDILTLVATGLGMELQEIDFSENAVVFAGTTLTVSAVRTSAGGDGRVNVGYIDATGATGEGLPLDLGAIVIKGDLGRIDAGFAFAAGSAVRGLTVQSMGEFGLTTQGAGATLESNLSGRLDFLKVAGNLREVFLEVTGPDAGLGSVTVGGSIIGGMGNDSGSIATEGSVGAVKIKGDLSGSNGQRSGSILAPEGIASVIIGGSLTGGDGNGAGAITSLEGSIGAVTIGGNLEGRDGDTSGRLAAAVSLGKIAIGGSVLGGTGSNTGAIVGGGSIASLKVGGNVEGGLNSSSGFIVTTGTFGKITIGGSLLGGSTTGGDFFSSGIIAGGAMGAVKILGSIVGGSISGAGSLDSAGSIEAGRIASLFVGGSIISGTATGGGILTSSGAVRASDDIGAITVKGSLVGNATASVLITARGQFNPSGTSDVAIKSLTVVGRVERAQILAGYDNAETPLAVNADAQIGKVVVGDWIASDLVAGATPDNGFFGDGDDDLITEVGEAPGIDSRIASILIKGTALGTTAGGDNYGFVAQHIGSLKIGSTALPLTAGSGSDLAGLALGSTGDLRVVEI